jgi:hypothetical protein
MYTKHAHAIIFPCTLLVLAAATPSRAQGFVSPLIGYDFGGNSGCPQINNCEDKRTNFGVAIGTMGKILGFEEELADAKNSFGCVGTQSQCVRMSVAKVRVGEGPTRRICARVGEGFPDILHGDGHTPRAWNTNCHGTRRPVYCRQFRLQP